MRHKKWITALAGLLALAALPLLGHWARHAPAGRCSLDGVPITPVYRVRVRDHRGGDHGFCCIRCAELWLARSPPAHAVWVTDEASGHELDARAAFFVRSSVVTTPTTGNRVHAFARQEDAERHADVAHGRLLDGPERPFDGMR